MPAHRWRPYTLFVIRYNQVGDEQVDYLFVEAFHATTGSLIGSPSQRQF